MTTEFAPKSNDVETRNNHTNRNRRIRIGTAAAALLFAGGGAYVAFGPNNGTTPETPTSSISSGDGSTSGDKCQDLIENGTTPEVSMEIKSNIGTAPDMANTLIAAVDKHIEGANDGYGGEVFSLGDVQRRDLEHSALNAVRETPENMGFYMLRYPEDVFCIKSKQ